MSEPRTFDGLTLEQWGAVEKIALTACHANGERGKVPCAKHYEAAEMFMRKVSAIKFAKAAESAAEKGGTE